MISYLVVYNWKASVEYFYYIILVSQTFVQITIRMYIIILCMSLINFDAYCILSLVSFITIKLRKRSTKQNE